MVRALIKDPANHVCIVDNLVTSSLSKLPGRARGPFEFVQYVKDANIRYKRFDAYFGAKAKLDTLVYSINKDPAVRVAKLKANECQVMPYPNPADLEAMKTLRRVFDPEGRCNPHKIFPGSKRCMDFVVKKQAAA